MKEDMIRAIVKGVAMPSEEAAPVIILEAMHQAGEVCIAVGASEAGTILMALEGISTPRPMTHELLISLLNEQGVSINAIEIYGFAGEDEGGFLARIKYHRGLHIWTRDIRPSDALAIAVLSGTSIYISRTLLGKTSSIIDNQIEAEWLAIPKQAF